MDLEDNVNPQDNEGTTDSAIVQAIREKRTQAQAELAKEQEPKGNPEPEDDEAGIEADPETENDPDGPDQEDEGDGDTEDDSEQPKYTVKIGGKDFEVTLDEALSGYMKDQDYRQKTSEVALARKEVEAEKAKLADLSKVREQHLSEINALKGVVQSFIVPDEALDGFLKAGKPEDYLRAKNHNEKILRTMESLSQKETALNGEVTEEQKQQTEALRIKERESLYSAMPDLKSDENQKALGNYLVNLGFSTDDISNTLDHRLFVMAEKARRFDALQSKAKQKPVANVPKVLKGQNRQSGAEINTQKLKELEARARKTGNSEDIAALMRARRNQKGA